ncbi:hypothetical protein [Flavobacterium celericrescens]|uniref:Uncharacterized protein n=1 Tax=Flavobacterium celericrescens TaxID=2709780 RepID=A0ABX0IED6_9FLAO|nr:hypothetical protein [Flavobacterium celericrescens]NHM03730.1 hypothetical protein [Flavobacterium celericrescens]
MIDEIYSHCIQNDRYGFTIPYLYKIEKDNNREKSIEEILEYLSKSEAFYIISKCNDLDEYIIGLHKKEYAPISYYAHFNNLLYDQEVLGFFESFQELSSFLTKEYQKYIDKGQYSKNIETLNWE